MLCPCGAAWSLDRLWQRWRAKDTAVRYVAPWAVRLLFVQMIFMYFCNGVYKLGMILLWPEPPAKPDDIFSVVQSHLAPSSAAHCFSLLHGKEVNIYAVMDDTLGFGTHAARTPVCGLTFAYINQHIR